jgi:ribosome biogenesis GTPase / thiamine phosphate phosphatase
VSLLQRLGWDPFFEAQRVEAQRAAGSRPALRFARVVEEQRGAYRVAGEFDGSAEVSGRFRFEAAAAADFPAVGDWVGVDSGVIHVRLERRTTVSRAAAGRAVDQQVVAANVDTILVVCALTRDLNPRRIERYLTMVWEAGARPVVLLNKADLCRDPVAASDAVRLRLPFVDVVTVSAVTQEGLDRLAQYLRPAQTIALLGSSGVGKSTVVNRLLGHDALRVSDIDADGKGRHTTTSRQLVELTGGALLIDTPGMRELQPWADDAAIDAVFDDIARLAGDCRFADCAHAVEPGCAVRAAIETGGLDADRFENYRRLLREAAFEERKRDKAAAADAKRKWKQIHQAQRARYRERDRF